MPQKWALLIGIDYYLPGGQRKVKFGNLNGCVQDVTALEDYLRKVLKVTNITKLTSSPEQTEKADALPTHDNFVRELTRITDPINGAKSGDLVYIHYSGHGIRRDGRLPDDLGDNISGTALVPMDVLTGGAYLTGYQLGVFVKNMVTNGLRVAVTLDSCFSGRGLRHASEGVRTSENGVDDSILPSDEKADDLAQAADSDKDHSRRPNYGHRNAAVKHSWLSNPTDCTVLTACGVNEFAKEDTFGSGKHGVLTHYMLEILRKHPVEQLPSYERVSDYVKWRLTRERFAQRPVIHGDSFCEFFGERVIAQRPSCHVSETGNGLELDVGKAQGVAVDAIYKVYPESWDTEWGSTVDIDPSSAPPLEDSIPRVRVVRVLEYRSIVELLRHSSVVPSHLEPKTGSRATLHTWALPLPTYVRLAFFPNVDTPEGLESSLQTEIGNTPGLFLCPPRGEATPKFTLSLDPENNFEIHDDQGVKLYGTPKITLQYENAIQKLGYILRHLARFRAIEGQQYGGRRNLLPASNFMFELQTIDGVSLPISPSGKYEVVENDIVVAKLVNLETTWPAHVAIFNLNPTWGIQKIYPPGGQPVEETHSDEPIILPMTMEIPDGLGPESIEDILRAYIYLGEDPPSWDELALPDLPTEAHMVQHDPPFETVKTVPTYLENRHFKPPRALAVTATRSDVWTVLDLTVRTSRAPI